MLHYKIVHIINCHILYLDMSQINISMFWRLSTSTDYLFVSCSWNVSKICLS